MSENNTATACGDPSFACAVDEAVFDVVIRASGDGVLYANSRALSIFGVQQAPHRRPGHVRLGGDLKIDAARSENVTRSEAASQLQSPGGGGQRQIETLCVGIHKH
jgi:hypothetical protein